MYESLKEYSNIVISGPQRSGTRIASKIIAEDTSKHFVDERFINYHDFRLLEWYLDRSNYVIQCPGLCHLLHNIKNDSTLVIVIRRPIDEIIKSEHRCWDEYSRKLELSKYGYQEGIISEVKYNFWDSYQKSLLGDKARDLNYHDLETHPLFIYNREGFKWDQTN